MNHKHKNNKNSFNFQSDDKNIPEINELTQLNNTDDKNKSTSNEFVFKKIYCFKLKKCLIILLYIVLILVSLNLISLLLDICFPLDVEIAKMFNIRSRHKKMICKHNYH